VSSDATMAVRDQAVGDDSSKSSALPSTTLGVQVKVRHAADRTSRMDMLNSA
jgi:hypothetical protein